MEIKSKLELKTYVYYAGQKVQIISKRYEGKHNTWMYEVENKKANFKAFVKESDLTH